MLTTAIVAVSTLLFAPIITASAAVVQRTCSPTFSGDQSIYVRPPVTDMGVYEWTLSSYTPGSQVTLETRSVNEAFSTANWSILTQSNGLYTIIPVYRTLVPVALTAGDDGNLALGFAGTVSIATQQFSIDCDNCSDEGPEAKCTISHPTTGQCVVGSQNGDTLYLGSCNDAGHYSFITPIIQAGDA